MTEFLRKYQDYLMFIGLFLIAFLTKFPYLSLKDLSYDDPFTLFYSQSSISDIIKLSTRGEPHPPLFMMLVHWWNLWADYDVAKLRMLPLIFHALTAPVLFFTGKKFFGWWAGILAAGLFLTSTMFFYFAQELRGYGLFSLLTITALYFFLSSTEKPNLRNLGLLVFCNVLLVYNHYFGLFIIGVQGLCALFFIKNRVVFLRLLLALLLTGLLFLPMLDVFINQFGKSSQGTWVAEPKPKDYIYHMRYFLNGGENCRIAKLFLVIGVGLTLLLQRFFVFEKKYLVTLVWWIVPYLMMFLLSSKTPMFIDRYILFNTMGLFVFFGASSKQLFQFKWLQIGLVVFFLIKMFNSAESIPERIDKYFKRELKKAVSFIKSEQDEQTVVGVYPPWVKYHFSFHYALESFKKKDQLVQSLEEKNVIVSWGTKEYLELAEEISADQIILFTNNGFPEDTELIEKLQSRFPTREDHRFKEKVDVIILRK